MIEKEAPAGSTTSALLATLRQATGVSELEFAAEPTRLSGGFYAEMLRFRLTDPPAGLDRDLVARIVPFPESGRWEATIQRSVAEQGFPTPNVRLVTGETGPLGRYLIVMDALDGSPPMAGLGPRSVAKQVPALVRDLPDQLARVAASLHGLDPAPLASRLDALGVSVPNTTAGFVEQLMASAERSDRPDVASAGAHLLASEPPTTARAITHGDLHPFNLIVTSNGISVIDWTVARIAHPAFTVSFTHLVLCHPPVAVPRYGGAALAWIGRRVANRFLNSYRSLTAGTSADVDDAVLDWHRKVHALRILVEMAGWDANGTRPGAGHPWFILEPVATGLLSL